MHRHLSILAALMLLTATSLHAAPISIGTSFGYSHFSEASGGGSGLNAFGWPSTNDPLMHLLSPGLRLSLGLDDKELQTLYLDNSLAMYSSTGLTLTEFQFMAGYQYAFAEGSMSPYLTAGAGLMLLTESDGGSSSFNNPVVGGGFGVRHMLGHGHGSLRAEARFDRQFEAKSGAVPAMNVIGLKVGFDLRLQ